MTQPTRRYAIHPFKWLALACIALAQGCSQGAPEPSTASQTQAVSGAAFTTDNASVDGDSKDVCKNSSINCNIYGAKEYVWLNGGPTANGLGPDGDYFFAVLVPGGQPDPNDGSLKNLSDDYDTYDNRTFTVTDGEVSAYGGTHWLDSGTRAACHNHSCGEPDGDPPLIRLYPYADTTNPGGVYIMAICSLERGYPVEPRDCKYDAFKVKEGQLSYSLMLSGMKFQDTYADAVKDDSATDPGLKDWTIHITGTGFAGEAIDETRVTDENGYWDEFNLDYTFNKNDPVYDAKLTVCEEVLPGWTQSFPASICYDLSLAPAALAYQADLDFGNWQPVDVTACKVQDLDGKDSTTDDRVPVPGWSVSLLTDGVVTDTQTTGDDGCYTWTDLTPGPVYSVQEGAKDGWQALGDTTHQFDRAGSNDSFTYTFVNAVLQGCTPGFWQGGSDGGQAGGQWLWNEGPPDSDWTASGGDGTNPYIWTTPFNSFFKPYAGLNGFTMMDLVGTGGGPDDFQKAARSLVAAYLNASWGMNYGYTTTELEGMWSDAVDSGQFLGLHLLLDDANNAGYRTDGGPHCPISASLNF